MLKKARPPTNILTKKMIPPTYITSTVSQSAAKPADPMENTNVANGGRRNRWKMG